MNGESLEGTESREPHEWHLHIFSLETEDFMKGFAVTMIVLALLSVLIFIPPSPLGIVLTLTIGPYIAGYKGGRYTEHWGWLSILCGIIWASIEVMIIIYLANLLSYYGSAEVGALESLLILMVYFFNILFCSIGAKIGSEAAQKTASEKRRRSRS